MGQLCSPRASKHHWTSKGHLDGVDYTLPHRSHFRRRLPAPVAGAAAPSSTRPSSPLTRQARHPAASWREPARWWRALPSLAGVRSKPQGRPLQAVLASAAASPAGQPHELLASTPLAGGQLDSFRLEGERLLRVWTPPGYSTAKVDDRPCRYPLLLLNDGQNLFEPAPLSGRSWLAADTAAELIASGQLPPFVVAGIDHAGPSRSLEYLPYPPGAGPGDLCAGWPGGGIAAYMERVVTQILPWLQETCGASTDPSHLAFGGSSFGGICGLWAAMHYPGVFGAVLVESPSLWIAGGRFLREDVARHAGPWPQRIFLGMGTSEYEGISGSEDLADQATLAEWDQQLVSLCQELAQLLTEQGLGSSRLRVQIKEGAAHTEAAWAARLPAALAWLLHC